MHESQLVNDMSTVVASILRTNLERSLEIHGSFITSCSPDLESAAAVLISAYQRGRKAIFFGNGGSAADAQHLAAEFVGRYLRERGPLPALALSTNSSVVTAIGNDYGYEEVFARQLEALAAPGDVAVGLSTSGNSANVCEAIRRAKALDLCTIALTGASGGGLKNIADTVITAPSNEVPRIQECHILAGHALCDVVESMMVESRGGY